MHKTLLAIVFLSVALADTAFAHGNIRQLTAREVWRFDGTEDGEPFGDIRDYVVTKSGHLWMLDFKDQVIRRYGQNGKPLGTISRKGSGPGEMRNANGMAVSPSGSIWVNDPRHSRITIFKDDGTFERQLIRSIGGYSYRWGAWFDNATGDVVEQDFVARGARWRPDIGTGRHEFASVYQLSGWFDSTALVQGRSGKRQHVLRLSIQLGWRHGGSW